MAIKAIINNTEKEIEQIKNSNEQDIDYVYSRIGDTEVEGEPPISIKSIGGELANYRIYGNTVDGESVGDLVESGEHEGEYEVPVTVEGKNLIDPSKNEIRNTGVEYTVNNDMSITANGSTSSIFSLFLVKVYLTKGSYIISGCPQNGNQNTYRCEIRDMALSSLIQDVGTGVTYSIVTDGYYYYSIRIAQNYVCDNLTFYPMIRKADIEDDTYEPYHAPVTTPIYLPEPIKMVGDEAEYIDYAEQKQHRIGADDINVTLPALSTIKGTNTFSVNTSIQPSNIYIKDSFDYKKVFTATRTIEDGLPLNYKSIEDSDSTLKNYRIYGNTVDGESVGDLVTSGEHEGEYKVPVTVSNGTDTLTTPIYLPEQIRKVGDEAEYIDYGEQKQHRVRKNLFDKNSYKVSGYVSDNGTIIISGSVEISTFDYIKVTAQKLYSFKAFSSTTPSEYQRTVRVAYYDKNKNYLSRIVKSGAGLEGFSFETPVNCQYIRLSIDKNLFDNMLVKGNLIPIEYEPFIEDTELDAVLPVLPTITGTNTLSVGTEVKPSAVEVKGKLKR